MTSMNADAIQKQINQMGNARFRLIILLSRRYNRGGHKHDIVKGTFPPDRLSIPGTRQCGEEHTDLSFA